MKLEEFEKLGLSIKEYLNLPEGEKFKINGKYMYNPFTEEARKAPAVNPYQKKLYNDWEDGWHLLPNPFNFNFQFKMLVKNNEVIEMYDLNDDGEFILRED